MAIIRAIDEFGNKIWADEIGENQEKGKRYRCLYCGAWMFMRVSPNGLHHFVCVRGEEHKEPVCMRLVKQKKCYGRNISVADFHWNMLKETRGGGTSGGDGGHRPPEDDPDLEHGEIHSLRDLYDAGLYDDPDMKLPDNKYLHDMMINPQNAGVVFPDEAPTNLGPRAIVVQPDGIDWEYKWIRYVLRFRCSENNNQMQAVYFFQQFSDDDLFERTSKKFFEPGSGRILKVKYECVIIYGEWQFNRCLRCEILDPGAKARCNMQWKCVKYCFVADCKKSKYIGCFLKE